MSPTRELALQIAKECNSVTAKLAKRPECHTAFGGTARASNLKAFLQGNPSVLVATPGRLKDYLSEASTLAKFTHLRTVILDEADTMLEQGFLQDVRAILKLLPSKKKAKWQGMCFSATVPTKIRDVIDVVLAPGYTHLSTVTENESLTHERVPQYHVIVPSTPSIFGALLSLLTHEVSRSSSPSTAKIIVFGTTANLVALYCAMLRTAPFPADNPLPVFELHSRLSQSTRTKTTDAFKAAPKGLLLATDVVGRGMDFPLVTCVIQVGLPSSGEQYVHRVGRTARADQDGRAVTILTEAESFFLRTNPQLKIEGYSATDAINADAAAQQTAALMLDQVDEGTKGKAYSAYLGFMKTFMNKLRLNPSSLVAAANEFALDGMRCAEVPAMEKKTVGKMGLKGTPGLRYKAGDEGRGSRGGRENNSGRGGRGGFGRGGSSVSAANGVMLGTCATSADDGSEPSLQRKHLRGRGGGDGGQRKKPRGRGRGFER